MQIRDGAVVSSVAPIEPAGKSSDDSKVVEEVVEEATEPREGEMIRFTMLFRILSSVLRLWILVFHSSSNCSLFLSVMFKTLQFVSYESIHLLLVLYVPIKPNCGISKYIHFLFVYLLIRTLDNCIRTEMFEFILNPFICTDQDSLL
jgi:hypothetical protein